MTFSVITVVFNDEKQIEKTIQSVLEQSYKNIQYIIIDGKSTDNTLEIIRKYQDKSDTIVSKSDNGLYDAMNKALKYIKGDYVCFLNSGDTFFSKTTIEQAIASINTNMPQIIYGDTDRKSVV